MLVALDLANMIEAKGLKVDGPYGSVMDGLKALEKRKPDFAFVDLNLRDGDALPLVETLFGAKVPITFMTGDPDDEIVRKYGCNVLVKPFAQQAVEDEISARMTV